jgi:hypothetical protein
MKILYHINITNPIRRLGSRNSDLVYPIKLLEMINSVIVTNTIRSTPEIKAIFLPNRLSFNNIKNTNDDASR